MKQVIISQGEVRVEEVPSPKAEPDSILVETRSSCVSIGTELTTVKQTSLPLWKRALQQPENVRKVVESFSRDGIKKTIDLVQTKSSASFPTGYSAAGVVLSVGRNVHDFQVGDRVACAGSQYAHHAEVISVPKNLCVLIPAEVDFAEASSVALGAIALQGVRRASPTMGETFIVLGLGFLGQLTCQLLRSNGCNVIAMDLDPARVKLAIEHGAETGLCGNFSENEVIVAKLTAGIGADGVIITAASSSSEVVSQAFKLTRKKGRVVLVGDVGLDINRHDIYEKEIDFLISSSYGPGRYDNQYEEKGLDYPLPYVRWTENRNMSLYLERISKGHLNVRSLISARFPIDAAPEAFALIKSNTTKPLMLVLDYPSNQDSTAKTEQTIRYIKKTANNEKIALGIIGAGSFAKHTHLPLIKDHPRVEIAAISTRTGINASTLAKQYNAQYATTDYSQILNDPKIQAVLISTRHDRHAEFVLEALKAGKHILVEKPLATNEEDLQRIETACLDKETPLLLCGFNRRFSSHAFKLKQLFVNRQNPLCINYIVNAGYVPRNHWVHSSEGGGRNIGEACHFYDFFTYLTDSKVTHSQVNVMRFQSEYYTSNDNFAVNFNFVDGSIATLTYTACGDNSFPKETVYVHGDGISAKLNDYKTLTAFRGNKEVLRFEENDKGHKRQWDSFSECIKSSLEWPIPLWQQIQATKMSFSVEEKLK